MKEEIQEAAESRFGTDMDSIRGSSVYDLNTDLKRGFIEGAKWQAERTKETIFDQVDYKLLAKQKMLLIELSNTTNIDGLVGLIYFLDAFQDEAVDMHGKSETEVFALEGGQDE